MPTPLACGAERLSGQSGDFPSINNQTLFPEEGDSALLSLVYKDLVIEKVQRKHTYAAHVSA
jgi:hypothetical protein